MPRRRARHAVILLALLSAAVPTGASASSKSRTVPADTLYAHQDWGRAAVAYEQLTRREPSNGAAWYRLGVSYAQSGHPDQAIPAYRRAQSLGYAPASTTYNLACAYARTNDKERAFAALDSLVAAGFRSAQTLQSDPDLESLRSDPRFAEVLRRAQRNATPCPDAPESRQLDFWMREWDVRDRATGTPAGTSSVQLILGSCVIFENWSGLQGGHGKCFNSFNRARGWCQQNWVDDSGNTNDFVEGTYRDSVMVYQGEGRAPDGTKFRRRLSFFN